MSGIGFGSSQYRRLKPTETTRPASSRTMVLSVFASKSEYSTTPPVFTGHCHGRLLGSDAGKQVLSPKQPLDGDG